MPMILRIDGAGIFCQVRSLNCSPYWAYWQNLKSEPGEKGQVIDSQNHWHWV